MKFFLILFVFFVLNISMIAQTKINIKAGSGINNSSTIIKHKITNEYDFVAAFDNRPAFSFFIGSSFDFLLDKKSTFSINVLFFDKAFFSTYISDRIDNSYLYIPLYWKNLFKEKIGLSFGIVNNILLKSYFNENHTMKPYNFGLTIGIYYLFKNNVEFSFEIQADIDPYSSINVFNQYQLAYNYGAMLSVSYKLFEK